MICAALAMVAVGNHKELYLTSRELDRLRLFVETGGDTRPNRLGLLDTVYAYTQTGCAVTGEAHTPRHSDRHDSVQNSIGGVAPVISPPHLLHSSPCFISPPCSQRAPPSLGPRLLGPWWPQVL